MRVRHARDCGRRMLVYVVFVRLLQDGGVRFVAIREFF